MSEESAVPEFGIRLRAAMKEAKVSSGQLARALGVTGTTISRWLNGTRRPELSQIRLIARVLQRPVSHFVDEEPPFVNIVTDSADCGLDELSDGDLIRDLEARVQEVARRLSKR